MRIFISTGEVSGDLQGGLLIEGLKRQAKAMGEELEIVALGGDRMAAAGATLLGNTKGIGSVGLLEALPFILPTLQVQRRAKQHLRDNPPDLIVLLDYAGPNASIGEYVRQHLPQVPMIYYIAPQYWVWTAPPTLANRIFKVTDLEKMLRVTDRLLAIFPEEARFFAQQGADVRWVGHPLLDRMQQAPSREAARQSLGVDPDQLAVALFPVSRRQEVSYLFPVLFEAMGQLQDKLPQIHFLIPLSLPVYRQPIEAQLERHGIKATILDGRSLEAMAAADLAIAKSGTVNLEIALMEIPQLVVYRLNPATLWFARQLFKFSAPFLSPTNLVLMEPVVPELFQDEATPERIVQESLDLLLNAERRQEMLKNYRRMRDALGEVGVCDRAAREILEFAGERR